MKATYKKYYNLDSDTEASYVKWNISDGGDVEVPDLITTGNMGSTKEDLDALIQEVIQGYEAN